MEIRINVEAFCASFILVINKNKIIINKLTLNTRYVHWKDSSKSKDFTIFNFCVSNQMVYFLHSKFMFNRFHLASLVLNFNTRVSLSTYIGFFSLNKLCTFHLVLPIFYYCIVTGHCGWILWCWRLTEDDYEVFRLLIRKFKVCFAPWCVDMFGIR